MTKEEFKRLFDEYFDSVRNYIYYRSGDAELATDIAQDTFMKVWEKQFKIEKGKHIGLLYKIASDMFISTYRKKQVDLKYKNSLMFDFQKISPEDEMRYGELKKNYEKALMQISEKQRIVFLMSRNDGLKYHEIAEILKISVKAVEKRMKKALDYLKKALL